MKTTDQTLEQQNQKAFYQALGNTLIAGVLNMTVWFAITFYVYLQTKSVFATGLISGIYLVAMATSGIWFGSLVDHHKKKNIMMFSSAVSLVAYCLSFALYLWVGDGAFTDPASLALWIFIPLLLVGVIVGNIRMIAISTMVTFLIPENRRDKANGLIGTVSGLGFLVTSVISGFLVGFGGMLYVLILAIVGTMLAMLHLWFTPIAEKGIAHTEEHERKVDLRGTYKVIRAIPGLLPLILFATFNNFLGGVFMSLMDAYGLSMVSVQTWGLLWGILSCGFIVGGILITKKGLGKNPLRTMFLANVILWVISSVFTIQASIVLLMIGMFLYLTIVPFVEAAEQTILQKVVPPERQGRVFGFAQSVEQAASPLTAFLIGPLTQFIFIPFMTDGTGAQLIGGWFGAGPARGIALVFTIAGIIGLVVTIIAMRSKSYHLLSKTYATHGQESAQNS